MSNNKNIQIEENSFFYKGIKIDENFNIFKKNGEIDKGIERGLEKMINYATEHGHKIIGEYKGYKEKILIDFNCGHEPLMKLPLNYTKGSGCPNCASKKVLRAREKLLRKIENNNHILLTDIKEVKFNGYMLIDFNCGCQPQYVGINTYVDSNKYECNICQNKTSFIVAKNKFFKIVNERHWKVLEEYQKAKIHIEVECDKGHKFKILPSNVNRGHGCMECYKETFKKHY